MKWVRYGFASYIFGAYLVLLVSSERLPPSLEKFLISSIAALLFCYVLDAAFSRWNMSSRERVEEWRFEKSQNISVRIAVAIALGLIVLFVADFLLPLPS